MVDQVINGMIAGIIGAVAFIAVKALVGGCFYGPFNTYCYAGPTNPAVCAANYSNCTWYDNTAGEMLIHDILPLAVAILTVALLFMGLTRVKGAI